MRLFEEEYVEEKTNKCDLYTDGACIGNPGGKGSYAFAIVKDDALVTYGYGFSPSTTNNRMELSAIYFGIIEAINNGYNNITVYTDSKYCIGCADGSYKKLKKNKEMIYGIKTITQGLAISYQWIKGHDGNIWNEFCDSVCSKTIDSIAIK